MTKAVRGKAEDLRTQLEHAAENVGAVATDVGARTQSFISEAAERAEQVGSYLGQRAEDATVALGSRMRVAGAASESIAAQLKRTGSHLEKDGVEGLLADVTTLIQRNPVVATLTGFSLGFLVARIIYHRES